MASKANDNLVTKWTRLGAMFNAVPGRSSPDLELLLLDTARHAAKNPRLFSMATNWLARYGEYVSKHRLVRLIQESLESEHRSAMGLMLESVVELESRHRHRFQQAIKACDANAPASPLFDVERLHQNLMKLSELQASSLSRKWGRWAPAIELKDDALRPAHWVAKHNPALAARALLGGDLAASILADCAGHRVRFFDSEVALAKSIGASRIAVRDALRKLELAGYARRTKRGRSTRIEIRTGIAA